MTWKLSVRTLLSEVVISNQFRTSTSWRWPIFQSWRNMSSLIKKWLLLSGNNVRLLDDSTAFSFYGEIHFSSSPPSSNTTLFCWIQAIRTQKAAAAAGGSAAKTSIHAILLAGYIACKESCKIRKSPFHRRRHARFVIYGSFKSYSSFPSHTCKSKTSH